MDSIVAQSAAAVETASRNPDVSVVICNALKVELIVDAAEIIFPEARIVHAFVIIPRIESDILVCFELQLLFFFLGSDVVDHVIEHE